MLVMLEPTTLPTTISGEPWVHREDRALTSSGKDVPMATMVRPTTYEGIKEDTEFLCSLSEPVGRPDEGKERRHEDDHP